MKTDPEPHSPSRSPALVAVVPVRLAAATEVTSLPMAVDDSRHEAVRTRALEWQQQSGDAWFWEMAAAASPEGTAYALAGQMASVGEQLALAYSAAVEVALWQIRLTAGDDDEVVAEMSMRAMAEAQSLFVIGAGHALANVAVRALTLDHTLTAALVQAFARGSSIPTFAPFSEQPADWISLNPTSCRHLNKVAQGSGSQNIVALIKPVAELGFGAPWKALVERRGTDFHRWRPQTHGLQGIPHSTPWRHTPATPGTPGERVLAMGQPRYEDARGLAQDVADLASEAMFALSDAMDCFLTAWTGASQELGGPHYRLDPVSENGS